ncbi:hypothetical protein Nepgr_031662 [Nepenthes gracilis]|uniref:Uncharacterized protein n=1 Tax=Nepenthes gracilis TaxID=150966 RepID=A0AAD3Y7A3_NEPGR|nr:hypothetical protein Nepgr_031662 [Nepenthes gracilis]
MQSKAAALGQLGVRKGSWIVEEDLLLRQCIEKYGVGNWHQISQLSAEESDTNCPRRISQCTVEGRGLPPLSSSLFSPQPNHELLLQIAWCNAVSLSFLLT